MEKTSTMRPSHILVVDDHEEMARLLADRLTDEGHSVDLAFDGRRALELAAAHPPDLVLTDLLDALLATDPDLPVLLMTAFGAVDTAVEAMRRGARHYFTKPFRWPEVQAHVRSALADRALRNENRSLKEALFGARQEGVIGTSPAMLAVAARVQRLSGSDVPVLIRGESGTGKERLARALHATGPRSSASFVPINCASLPATLLESELFGHAKGAFTGASQARKGLFVEADGGTLFLDEIGDMPLELQGHLLRVLQEGTVRPVGSDTDRRVDVRILAATHQPLEQRIDEGKFRADLFYRLEVVPIVMPPLRDRREDLPLLIQIFLGRDGSELRLTPAAMRLLEGHAWPGNIRELENLMRRVVLLAPGPVVDAPDLLDLAPSLANAATTPRGMSPDLRTLRQVEADHIDQVLRQCEGNKTKAAAILGIDASTLHRRARTA
jgi:two-component system, NtrC family, response regulator HydG